MMRESFNPQTMTELTFGLPGRVYRSPMPFLPGDEAGMLLESYRRAGIDIVVVLVPRQEYLQKTGRDLVKVYQEAGMHPVEMPITDFSIPALEPLESTLAEVVLSAQAGSNIVVHCHAGFGRTGTFLACMAVRIFGFTGKQAIDWVRECIPPALENTEQYQFVIDYGNHHAHNPR